MTYSDMAHGCFELWKDFRNSKQAQFYVAVSLVGLLLFTGTLYATIAGFVLLAPVGGALLAIGVFEALVYIEADHEVQQIREVYHRGQSYTFMAGPVLMPAMLMLAAHSWGAHAAALGVERGSQWFFGSLVAGLGLILLCGKQFRAGDNGRYRDEGCERMLKSPTKWWIDHWQVPILTALVLVTVVPTWFVTTGMELGASMSLVFLFAVFGFVDSRRNLDPHDQHVEWDAKSFCRIG